VCRMQRRMWHLRAHVVEERRGENGDLLILHDALHFGGCTLNLAVPEEWEETCWWST